MSKQLDELKAKGINSVAIAFVHSYLWSEHEEMVARIAKEKGFAVSVSSELQPMVSALAAQYPHSSAASFCGTARCLRSVALTISGPQIKLVARANSSIADSYLTPVTRRYIESFGAGFEGGIEAFGSKLLFMQSDGGLCRWNNFSGGHSFRFNSNQTAKTAVRPSGDSQWSRWWCSRVLQDLLRQ